MKASERGGNVVRIPRCPICNRPRSVRYRPFCSKRCRDVDLSRWFNQVYAVPAVDETGLDEASGDEDEER